uniref:Uncharacterized protein n=1 Tax=Rhizophora mucronata TaxID=61149 RepID=A0A2P2PL07_RHIMU
MCPFQRILHKQTLPEKKKSNLVHSLTKQNHYALSKNLEFKSSTECLHYQGTPFD